MSKPNPFLQYRQKPKKPYTGPPRPNLMSQAKELRLTKEDLGSMRQIINQQAAEIEKLQSKIRRMDSELAAATSFLRRMNKGA